MPHPAPLPDGLVPPFSVAAARRLGVPEARLRRKDLSRPFHGVRSVDGDAADDGEASTVRRAIEYSQRMREEEFFSHVTAAILWGLPLPPQRMLTRNRGDAAMPRPLDVGVTLPARAGRARGIRGRSVSPHLAEVCTHPATGLRVSTPATVWAELAAELVLEDLVAVGDAAVREPMWEMDAAALASLADLDRALHAGRRLGIERLRAARPLVRARSRSRPETHLRLAVLHAGLPEPECNWPVLDGDRLLALLDLAYPAKGVCFEYEGEHHLRDAEQWARDIRRHEMLVERGWRIVRVTKDDLYLHRGELFTRIRLALAARY
ncbi:hypothetical protein [Microbacterium schleiferi]|uniref:DUF559 domain-containing protein n=1 Tax=Microbacterium schleiferi TaxID=69362 RepID=A0ABU7V3J3_9MICO|nr:hypothetical protein [Micrococcales bacterium]